MNVPISPKKITHVLALIVVGLSLASLAGQYYTHFLGDDTFWLKVAEKLDVNREDNSLPTWYQTVSLFSCFLLLAVIAAAARAGADRYTRHWVILALVFLYLSADEFLVIHERVDALRSVFPTRGAFYYTWVIPAAFFVLLFALAYLKFLFHLPDRTRSLFIAAGALYVGGALGMEMVTGSFIDSHADILAAEETFTFAVLNAIEEFLEMTGIVVFVNGLLSYLNLHAEAGRGNSVSGACAGLSGGGNERQVMKPLGKDPSCERKRLHTVCGIFAGVSGLSMPRAPQGAVHIADVRIAETERGEHRAFTPVTALYLFGLPLLDGGSLIVRRILRGRSPFAADREHLHHILQGGDSALITRYCNLEDNVSDTTTLWSYRQRLTEQGLLQRTEHARGKG